MKRKLIGILAFLILAAPAFGQYASRIVPRATLPATCQVGNGMVIFLTVAPLGVYYCAAANTWQAIGATGAAGDVIIPAGAVFGWTGRSRIRSAADSTITLTNAAGADFNLLRFGGTTAAFPALKRVGAQLTARVGDDTATASFGAKYFEVDAASTFGYSFIGRSYITSPADGQLQLNNNAGTGFTLLMMGGAANTFPAFKRNTTTAETKLADDSAYTRHAALEFQSTGSALAALGAPPNGTIKYCSDCDPLAAPGACTNAGAKTGSLAAYINGAWRCY